MLKVGVVGVGKISTVHINGWKEYEGAELVALCDVRPELMEAYPEQRHYTDFETMLDSEELDVVDICLPTYLHAEYAKKAMERGKHVLCEKPISLNKQDVTMLYETAKRNNVHFMTAQVVRFMPAYRLLIQMCNDGRYGKLLSGTMTRRSGFPSGRWEEWMQDEKKSGHVPYDFHIHDLDFLVYAFGRPDSFECYRDHKPDQDCLNMIYHYGDVTINAQGAWYAGCYPFTAAYVFQFEDAVVANEGDKLTAYTRDGQVKNLNEERVDTGDMGLSSGPYAAEIRYFAECIRNNESTFGMVHPDSLITVQEILEEITK